MADQLKSHSPDIDIRFMLGDALLRVVNERNYRDLSRYPFGTLQLSELHKYYANGLSAAEGFLRNESIHLNSLGDLAKRALPNFTPDVIFTHETHAPFLNHIWPEAVFLHSMYGMTYRHPYPKSLAIDTEGLYTKSILATYINEICKKELSKADSELLAKIKGWYATQIISHDPIWPLIESEQAEFDKIILVPLQVDGYFAFDALCDFKNQLNYLEDVLRKTPSNWGVVVTMHGEYDESIDQINLSRLKQCHPNLIFKPEILKVPCASQALLAHVDAVVSVSSSIALQALIFDIPVISAGKSHINSVACCTLEKIDKVFDLHRQNSRDPILHFMLTRYHHVRKSMIDEKSNFYALINEFYTRSKRKIEGIEKLPPARPLEEVFSDLKSSSQWRSWAKLLNEKNIPIKPHPVLARIVHNEAISWDLFDTLVDRPFIHPHELFQFLELKVREISGNIYFPFHHLRRVAEQNARAAHNHRLEVTIDEIYENLKKITGFDDELLCAIKKLEISAEISVIRSRAAMKRTWNLAGTFGKVRSIITDIYLEQEIIEEVLNKNGFGDFDFLYVSATEKLRKEDGSIFPQYRKDLLNKYPKISNILHIGDNPRADGEMARAYGLESVIIPRAADSMRQTELGKRLGLAYSAPSYDSSIITGLIANKYFSSPISNFDTKSICNGSLFGVGYAALGPFVLGYVQWLIRRMKFQKIDHAYFLARDGYLIMKVYEAFKAAMPDLNLPDHSYLLCSRRSVMVPGISSIKDINEIATLNYGTTTVADFLKSRYGLDSEKIPYKILRKHGLREGCRKKIHYPRDLPFTIKLVADLEKIILDVAKEERVLYLEYLEKEGLCDQDKKIALVDIGYSGTMQRKIRDLTGGKYYGYYMLTHNYVLHHFHDQVFEGWLEDYDSQRSPYRHQFNQFIPLVESLLSSPEGSLTRFHGSAKHLEPEYLYSSAETERCAFLAGAHDGAMKFVNDFLDRFAPFGLTGELSPQVSSHLMMQLGAAPTLSDVSVFEGLILENMFAGSEFNIISNPHAHFDENKKLNQASFDKLLNDSKWKQGAQIALSKYLVTPRNSSIPHDVKINISDKNSPAINQNNSPAPPPNFHGAGLGNSLSSAERKRKKLSKNPRAFFEDAKNPLLRPVKYLFGNNAIGNLSSAIIRRLVN
nr:hypothetical protein [Chromobacterium sp. ASV5]